MSRPDVPGTRCSLSAFRPVDAGRLRRWRRPARADVGEQVSDRSPVSRPVEQFRVGGRSGGGRRGRVGSRRIRAAPAIATTMIEGVMTPTSSRGSRSATARAHGGWSRSDQRGAERAGDARGCMRQEHRADRHTIPRRRGSRGDASHSPRRHHRRLRRRERADPLDSEVPPMPRPEDDQRDNPPRSVPVREVRSDGKQHEIFTVREEEYVERSDGFTVYVYRLLDELAAVHAGRQQVGGCYMPFPGLPRSGWGVNRGADGRVVGSREWRNGTVGLTPGWWRCARGRRSESSTQEGTAVSERRGRAAQPGGEVLDGHRGRCRAYGVRRSAIFPRGPESSMRPSRCRPAPRRGCGRPLGGPLGEEGRIAAVGGAAGAVRIAPPTSMDQDRGGRSSMSLGG